MACDMAEDWSVNFPVAGNKNAEIDWLQGSITRHKNLTLCKYKNISLFRSTVFTTTKVMEFFYIYERALNSWECTADR